MHMVIDNKSSNDHWSVYENQRNSRLKATLFGQEANHVYNKMTLIYLNQVCIERCIQSNSMLRRTVLAKASSVARSLTLRHVNLG